MGSNDDDNDDCMMEEQMGLQRDKGVSGGHSGP
jgi:hypothetical protein